MTQRPTDQTIDQSTALQHLAPSRRGVAILELVIAAALLAALLGITQPIATVMQRAEAAQVRRHVALQELANIHRRILAAASDDASDATLDNVALRELLTVRDDLSETLPEARIESTRDTVDDWTQLTLTLSWGTSGQSVELTSLLPAEVLP